MQRTTKAKRKLIGFNTLKELQDQTDVGVPLCRAIRNLDLDVSYPVVTKLLTYYKASNSEIIYASLFPPWLNENDKVKENPDNYAYTGRFPFGIWEVTE